MAKKRFTSSFEDIFTQQPERHGEDKGTNQNVNANRKIKSTYLYDEATLDTIKAISYYRRMPIGDVLNEACESFINSFEELDKAKALYESKRSGK